MPSTLDRIPSTAILADHLTRKNSGRFTLFVGSAISCAGPAHVPSVPEVLRAIRLELLDGLAAVPSLRSQVERTLNDPVALRRLAAVPFESLWERVARVTQNDFVKAKLAQLCRLGRPNFNHHAIAWLAKRGLVRTVVTTNYDEFIETEMLGGKPPSVGHFELLNESDPMFVRARLDSDEYQLLKIHGTVSRPASMAFMFPQITAGFSKSSAIAIREVLSADPVLFVGYGCNDWDLRGPLQEPLTSVWAIYQKDWSLAEERCRLTASHHSQSGWIQHDLKGDPRESVLVSLACHFGCPPDEFLWHPEPAPKLPPMLDVRDPAQKTAILAELLDSIAVEVASKVYAHAATQQVELASRRRSEISAFITIGHSMAIPLMIAKGTELQRRSDLTSLDQLSIETHLAFAELIGGDKINGLRATCRLWRHLLAVEGNKTPDDVPKWQRETILADARRVVAHNLLRVAWFHLPGNLGRTVRAARAVGVRRALVWWAARVLAKSEPYITSIGNLAGIANLARERAHTYCLAGRWSDALATVSLAEEALEWGHWHQWKANAVRSRGWIWLWVGGESSRLRDYADDQAKRAFLDALDLARTHVTEMGEMVDDRIKAMLELKRLSILRGEDFPWEHDLEHDLEIVRLKSTEAFKRYRLIADLPPQSREPIG